jgi:hypothetical protein
MMLRVELADREGLQWAQRQVAAYHYLHTPVDVRCSLLAYLVLLDGIRVGCLIFGRPEAQRCNGWYGSVEDVATGRCRITRWQVLNLARVWLSPDIQRGGPHFVENAATWSIAQALHRVPYDYLLTHPPCFLDEPWLVTDCLSYCDTSRHAGTLYRAANFRLERENERGIQTYDRPLRYLTRRERQHIELQAKQSLRSRRYRAMRAASHWQQTALFDDEVLKIMQRPVVGNETALRIGT